MYPIPLRTFGLVLASLLLSACVRDPVYVSDHRYAPLDDGALISATFAADGPAPAAPRLAFWTRPIHEGDQGAIAKALQDGKETARSIGADAIRISISEPDARRQVVTIDFYRTRP